MQDRRTFLGLLSALAAAFPFAPRSIAAAPAAGQDFVLVNGWVLTRADLNALNIDAL